MSQQNPKININYHILDFDSGEVNHHEEYKRVKYDDSGTDFRFFAAEIPVIDRKTPINFQ